MEKTAEKLSKIHEIPLAKNLIFVKIGLLL